MLTETEKIKPIKLKEEELVCGCGGKLVGLGAAEIKKLRLRINVSRGIYRCPDCDDIKTIGLTTLDDELKEWAELIEGANDLVESEEEERNSLIDNTIQTLKELPLNHTAERRLDIKSIGRVFGCAGTGPSCELYWLASSGLGNLSICKGKYCKYDPYPKEYKDKEWFGIKWSNWFGEPLEFWKKRTRSALPIEDRVDALRRLGSIRTPEVEEILIGHLDKKMPTEIRMISIEALAHFHSKKAEIAFAENISSKEEPLVLKAILMAIRKNDSMTSILLVEKINCLVFYDSLQKDMEITLRVIKTRACRP